MPGVALLAEDRLLGPGKISPGEDRDDFVAPFLDVCAAAFFSIHQHDDESNLSAGFLDRIYPLYGVVPGAALFRKSPNPAARPQRPLDALVPPGCRPARPSREI